MEAGQIGAGRAVVVAAAWPRGRMCWRSQSRPRLSGTRRAAAWVLQRLVGNKKQQQAEASTVDILYKLCQGAACERTAGCRQWP